MQELLPHEIAHYRLNSSCVLLKLLNILKSAIHRERDTHNGQYTPVEYSYFSRNSSSSTIDKGEKERSKLSSYKLKMTPPNMKKVKFNEVFY